MVEVAVDLEILVMEALVELVKMAQPTPVAVVAVTVTMLLAHQVVLV